MLRFGEANLRQILDLSIAEAESSKIRGREFGKALLIESIFEVLQGQSAMGKMSVILLIFKHLIIGGKTYNCRISKSLRPRAWAAAFCLLATS